MSPPATAATPTSSASAAPPTVTLLEREPSWQTSAHRAFLDARAAATRHAGAAIGWQMELAQRAAAGDGSGRGAGGAGAHEPPGAGPAPASTRPVWNEGDLLEFAQGSIARVFGPAYAPIDQYHRRVRLPMPPYLLVSRVTRLDAERGEFRPSTMTTEYDIPPGAWYSVDGQIPWAVAVESGQCDLLLISYIGIDFECRGERVYRLLDCTLTFLDRLPREGKTLRYDITIDSYARSGDNLLFFFRYDCFVDDRLVLTMRGGCAGFFSDQELERGRGVIYSDAEIAARARIEPRHFVPPLTCQRRSFDERDLAALSAGDPRSVFGAAWEPHGLNRSLRLPPEAMRMFDRVVSVDPTGGAYGLGALVAEKDLRPDDWYFPCHFKADEVLAGSLMADGCVQLMQLYLLFLGFQTRTENARFQPIPGLPQVVRCRGQVTPRHSRLTYRMEITDLGLDPLPYARADVEIVVDGKIVVHFKDLGLQLEEAPDGRRPPPIAVRPALLDERHVDAFATGRMADCFGPEYAIYDRRAVSRQPNDDLQLISRVVEVQATRHDLSPGSSLTSEYDVPADPWFYRENAAPEVPYSMLMEIALQPCGFLSAWLGSTLPFPDEEFHFRNLDGQGRLLRNLDLRGRTIVNRARLRSSTTIQGVVLQSFDFELSCDGEPFYVGDASFGHFATATLANQVGLDAGRPSPSWLVEHPDADVVELDPRALERAPAGRPHYRLPAGRLDLLDRVAVVEHGGRHGRGYVFASHPVDPTDWFYACHFYQDPVMPGSLGVEAIAEALQALALRLDLGGAFQSPRFGHPSDHLTVWKYRGQIVPGNGAMSLEAHVKRIDRAADRVTIVADASLWRDDLRIYEVTDLALTIEEG